MEKDQLLKVKVSFKPHVNPRGTCLKQQATKKNCNFFLGGMVSVLTI